MRFQNEGVFKVALTFSFIQATLFWLHPLSSTVIPGQGSLLTGSRQDKDEEGNKITFTHKSRIFQKELHVNVTKPGSKKPAKKKVTVDQKQMVYFSEKYAKKQKADREAMIARARDIINHPKKYDRITAKGSTSYVKNISFDKTTGEIVDGHMLALDMEKIEEEEKYDGYYSIVTSEFEMTDLEMHKAYKGLARIEDSFKVTKTYFESRPVYVRTNPHIDAHFSTCFLALVLMRLLELNSQTLRFLLVIKSLLTQLSGYGAYNPAPEIKIFPPPKGGGLS